jgi:hypothetical protein
VRGLADHDPDQFGRILAWPLDDALRAWRERIHEELEISYRYAALEHAVRQFAGGKGLQVPEQLKAVRKEMRRGG